ncbi:MAG TPA: hypothetical protein VLF91_01385 [Candidatus Saccharimonadales bacterium]|nr:hypothetical protein [Candidatus Saccharimonadales bacterium]
MRNTNTLVGRTEAGTTQTEQQSIWRSKGGRRVTGVLGALLCGAPFLAACTTPSESADASTLGVTTYKGRDLLCRVEPGSYKRPSYDCDFVGFYRDPNYVAPDAIDKIKPGTFTELQVIYQGAVLTCLVYPQDHNTFGQTCDYVGYYPSTSQ